MVSVWSSMARAGAVVREVARRFPLPIAMGVAGAAVGCALVVRGARWSSEALLLDVLFSCWLGVSVSLAAALAAERRALPVWAWNLAAVGLCAACFGGLRGEPQLWQGIRFSLWMIAAHGLVAILPVVPLGGLPGRAGAGAGDFRAFNLMLFTRAVGGLVITHVLFAGLSFALQAIDKLFDVHVPDRAYGCLWFGLMGVVNTVYVLAGIPRGWDRLAATSRPPPLFDVLARYVLLPLSALYLVILYVYSARIIWMHEWPRGWVSAPIIVFSAVGLLTVLLLGPDGDRGTRFARAYCKSFFVALMPLVVLLFMAISRRAGEYGLTEERCLVYAIAVFLGIIAPYFVFSRQRRLASIPIALGAIALVTSVGPLSATSLSMRSQTARLRALLASNHLLDRSLAPRVRRAVSSKDEVQISAVLKFLDERRQMKVVATLGGPECAPCAGWRAKTPTPTELLASLGLTYRPWGNDYVDDKAYYYATQTDVIDTHGFDWLLEDISCETSDCSPGWNNRDRNPAPRWELTLAPEGLVVERAGVRLGTVPLEALRFRVEAGAYQEEGRRAVDPKLMRVEGNWDCGGYRLSLAHLTVHATAVPETGSHRVQSLRGRLQLRSPPCP